MKRYRYHGLLILYGLIFFMILVSIPQKINWSESFSRLHTIPFGCYILYEELDDLFPGLEVREVTEPNYNSLQWEGDNNEKIYISINREFTADQLDINTMLDFVSAGNMAFIVAESFPDELLDTLGLQVESTIEVVPFDGMPVNPKDWPQHKLTLDILPDLSWIEQRDFQVSFFEVDSFDTSTQILGWIDSSRINFVRLPYGNGSILLNSSPFMFTNFNLLSYDNHQYIAYCLGYTEGKEVFWDEYYKAGRTKYAQSPLATLLKDPSFKIAIYLALIGILLFLVFHAKRRQRIIPEIEPYKNTSLEFTRTLGDLYYEQGNHLDLAIKKIHYLKDYLAESFRMKNITFSEAEIPFVARRSGHPEAFVKSLFQIVRRISSETKISSELLIRFNHNLQIFYHRTNTYGESGNV